MLAYAVGVIGLRRDDFEWMTPAEYIACIQAWGDNQEQKQRRGYELERFSVWLEHGKQNSTVEDMCTFPWEKDRELKITGKVISNGKTDAISKT